MLKYTYKRFWKEYTGELNKKDLEHLKSYLEIFTKEKGNG